ncbi:MAG: alpha/beta hydrolase [Candidatus Binatia bacterium]|nr:alpha/beta hydrolase [Candidatus Binatia bacterium]
MIRAIRGIQKTVRVLSKVVLGVVLVLVAIGALGVWAFRTGNLPDFYRWAYASDFSPTDHREYLTLPGDRRLETFVYTPSGWSVSDRRPAVVLFFGGAWRLGSPWQFAPYAAHFAERGMVAFLPDYRVGSRDGTGIVEATQDAVSFARWLTENAASLGVDPEAIVFGGGSAGGQLAAAVPVVRERHNATDDLTVDPQPAALLLFNPAVNFDVPAFRDGWSDNGLDFSFASALSVDPMQHLTEDYPPCLVLHGTQDSLVPIDGVRAFTQRVNDSGGNCSLVPFEGRQHGFFNKIVSTEDFEATVQRSDEFLAGLGLLPSR